MEGAAFIPGPYLDEKIMDFYTRTHYHLAFLFYSYSLIYLSIYWVPTVYQSLSYMQGIQS